MKNGIQSTTVKIGAIIMVLCFVCTWTNFNLIVAIAGIAFLISMYTIICFLAMLIDGQQELLRLPREQQPRKDAATDELQQDASISE